MTRPTPQPVTFPSRFLWGASTSAHQVEGHLHNQWSVWELENAKSRAAQAKYHLEDLESWPNIQSRAKDPANYVSGASVDHRSLYEKDFDLLQQMNMNAYRFSVEWSRVEPREGAWDAEAIEYYKQYVRQLNKRGIEPIVTLFHFTLPVWFSEKGGFEHKNNVRYFVRFAEKIVSELGGSVRLIITLNEPEVYAVQSYMTANWPPAQQSKLLCRRVLLNLAYAHNQTAKAIHALNRRYKLSIAKNSSYIYPGDDAVLSRGAASVLQFIQNDYFMRKVIKNCDFIGLNYYFSDRVYGYRVHNPNQAMSDLGWDMQPENIQFALERMYEKYALPIIVTENGIADESDQYRKWWLQHTLLAMQRAMSNGVKLQGYLHWSLLDNFEWAYGKWPCFGLASVDYRTMERTLRPSARWFGGVIKKIRG